ncbi:bifunctional folylpolyglutamate synthase/dihydrofolate synthase [Leptolyngbya sp. 'hensonii']|nr:bifunctional folylpolyglutamate synthase/dihydrofolate synthase [Leptolyngbya sp. 'hensonii']
MTDVDTWLGRFAQFGVELGLERIEHLLAALGNPHREVPVIHVAGTNGKGSVCAYLSAILTQAGYRVGRYTSPHLVDWYERICLNEKPIGAKQLFPLLAQVEAAIDPDSPSPTQFEVITAAAWLYFAQRHVDVAVMEVGLGGRLDATNVCDRPLVSIITSIGWDHWQRLGSTLGEIAAEKAGILKPGCPAVVGSLPPEAETVIRQRIDALACPATWPEAAVEMGRWEKEIQRLESTDVAWDKTLPIAEFHGIQYPLPLHGKVQLMNSALAISALLILRNQGWDIPNHDIADGMAKAHWPGRLEYNTWHQHPLLIDGAHNRPSATVLREFIDSRMLVGQPVRWVMGMLSTKDHAGILEELLRPGDALYLVPVPDHSSADLSELVTLAHEVCPTLSHCQAYPDLNAGLTAACDRPNARSFQQHPVVLCGSLYLIGSFLRQQRASA